MSVRRTSGADARRRLSRGRRAALAEVTRLAMAAAELPDGDDRRALLEKCAAAELEARVAADAFEQVDAALADAARILAG